MGQTYIRVGIFKLAEVLDFVTFIKSTKEYTGKEVKMNCLRYQTFKVKGIKCARCDIEGKFFALESHRYNSGHKKFHFNLYALDDSKKEVLMTKDHIVPKARGGLNRLDNLQTMCSRCNILKADIL